MAGRDRLTRLPGCARLITRPAGTTESARLLKAWVHAPGLAAARTGIPNISLQGFLASGAPEPEAAS